MPKHALVVKTDLTTELLDIAEGGLKKLQSAVDGLIQPVDISPEATMWVNEEGLLRNDLSMNYIATMFMSELGYQSVIMGDVVFTGGSDDEGNTIGFSNEAVAELSELVASARELLGAIA
jgi:hypothetical protein